MRQNKDQRNWFVAIMVAIMVAVMVTLCACSASKYSIPEEERIKLGQTEFVGGDFVGHWEGNFKRGDGSFSVDITDVDFRSMEITGKFTAKCRMNNYFNMELNTQGTYPLRLDYDRCLFEVTQDYVTYVFEITSGGYLSGVTVRGS